MGITDAWAVIVNPKAGNGRGLKDWPVISNQMYNSGLRFTCLFTEHKYHAVELAVKAINDGYRNIAAVGGDGTIHEVVNGIFIQKTVPTTEISLAVIPAGTESGWIRMYGISRTYSEAVKSLVQKRTVLQDVAKVSYFQTSVQHTRYMANVAGMGYDAALNLQYNRLKDEGKYARWRYVRNAFKTFLRYSPVRLSFLVDGKEFYSGKVFSAMVGIGKNDSRMDLSIQKKAFRSSSSIRTRCRSIEVVSWPQSRIEIDGETVGKSPFKFEIVPHAIKVVVGANYLV